MDRTERFYRIDQLLHERRVVPIEIFLGELEISRATFKRDIEYLRDRLNAPIVWDRDAWGYRFGQPLAGNLEQRVQDDARYEQCIKAGVIATFKGLPPAIAVEFARRVLPHEVRPSFEETEKLCRASRSEGQAAPAEAA